MSAECSVRPSPACCGANSSTTTTWKSGSLATRPDRHHLLSIPTVEIAIASTSAMFRILQADGAGRRGYEQRPDRRLRAAVRLPLGCLGEPHRVGRLAVFPALRRALGVRSTARRAGRALVDPPHG